MSTTKETRTQEEINKSAAITHAIEVKSAFELYAYRIITHDQYISQITDLVNFFIHTTQQHKLNPILHTQADLESTQHD